MIVKCIQNEPSSENFIGLNKQYEVIEIHIGLSEVKYRVISTEDPSYIPIVVDSRLFEVVDSKIPPDWKLEQKEKNYLILRPINLSTGEHNFWDDYFDGTLEQEAECKKIVEAEVEKIKKFHSKHELKGSGN